MVEATSSDSGQHHPPGHPCSRAADATDIRLSAAAYVGLNICRGIRGVNNLSCNAIKDWQLAHVVRPRALSIQ